MWSIIRIDTGTNQQPQQNRELLELLNTLQSSLAPMAEKKFLQPRCTHSWKAVLNPHNHPCVSWTRMSTSICLTLSFDHILSYKCQQHLFKELTLKSRKAAWVKNGSSPQQMRKKTLKDLGRFLKEIWNSSKKSHRFSILPGKSSQFPISSPDKIFMAPQIILGCISMK